MPEAPVALWTVDEVFDAADETVVNGAMRYAQRTDPNAKSMSDYRFILSSPTRFGHYTLSVIFETLPRR
jgi:hypothetical protein